MTEPNTVTEATAAPVSSAMDIVQIKRLLPHRFPFLLIDRVLEIERKKRLVAIKNVSANEPFFQGHFPDQPIMPGVLIIEAMAQAGTVLLRLDLDDRRGKLAVISGIERAKFRRPTYPGDQLRIEISVLVWRGNAGKMQGKAWVGDKLVCEAVLSCFLINAAASTDGERTAE